MCYVDAANGDDAYDGNSPAFAKKTISAAVSQVSPGGDVHVAAGIYEEDVVVTKAMTIEGAGAGVSIVVGQTGGASVSAFDVDASQVTIAGFTITREGNNTTDWNDPSLNTAGVAVQGVGQAVIRDNLITGNRTGIDINASNGNQILDNVIDFNRTGLIYRNSNENNLVSGNAITNNWTVGAVWLPGVGDSAAGTLFTNNDISGNWYAQIDNRSTAGGFKNFSGNWLGTNSPTVAASPSGEPGYGGLIPVEYGGAATPPAGDEATIRDNPSGFVDYTPWLDSGADASVDPGFDGDLTHVHVSAASPQSGSVGRIDEGIDLVDAGGTVELTAHTFLEQATIDKDITLTGASAATTVLDGTTVPSGSGLTLTGARDGVTISDLTVQDFKDSGILGGVGIPTLTDTLITDVVATTNNSSGSTGGGITFGAAGMQIQNLTIDDVDASGNTQRGIVFWDAVIDGLTISDSTINSNTLVGLAINDSASPATNVNVIGNTANNNGDSGFGIVNLGGSGTNRVADNDLTSNGRFGIEIKNSAGNGATSGPGSVVVEDNSVVNSSGADARDKAGISVYRRGPTAGSPDQPTGIAVVDNTVSGYTQPAAGDGFGILIEGTGHLVTGNTVTTNDVGIQVQGGNTPDVNGTPGFDRGSAAAGEAEVHNNSISGNGIGLRVVGGTASADATCNWWGHFSGPAPGGSGDSAIGTTDVSPWLLTSNLSGTCGVPASVTVSDVTVLEGDAGSSNAQITVTATPGQTTPLVVDYHTEEITADDGDDYTGTASGSVTILANQSTATILVPINGDTDVEPDETFAVVLDAVNGTGSVGSPSSATVTIDNDDLDSANVAFVSSSSAGAPKDQPAIDRLQAMGHIVTVVDDNALPGAVTGPSYDLIVMSSSVAPATVGNKLTNVDIPIVTWEGKLFDELKLSSTGAETSGAQTKVAIVDPGHPVAAGFSGVITILDTAKPINKAGTPGPGVVVVASTIQGQGTILAADVGVDLVGGLDAPARRVTLPWNVDGPNATNANGWALFDAAVEWAMNAPLPPASVTVSDLVIVEGNSGTTTAEVTVTADTVQASDLVVSYTTHDGTADSGDYTGGSSTVTILAGQSTAVIEIPILGDTDEEADETFQVELTSVAGPGVVGSPGTATVTIEDDDSTSPTVAFLSNLPTGAAKDQVVIDKLETMGYTVTIIDDDVLTPASVAGFSLVVVSSSVAPAKVGTKLTAVAVPVVSWEGLLADELGLANTSKESTNTQTKVAIVTPAHPVAAGLTGTVTILSSATKQNQVGAPAAGVIVVANNQAGAPSILAADAGATLNTGPAPERRVNLSWNYDSPPVSNANGWAIFEAAVDWATS